ncbi:MAG: hemerythrin domain-containing protein [Deltaproteobacteria bacterium]|nr:hemerythrin domain-containing protein [Deltaproteobacteria bacterium]
MSENKMVDVQYECLNPSCQVYCKKGVIVLEESYFNELSEAMEGENIFRGPQGHCRMGFSQPYKAISVTEASNDEVEGANSDVVNMEKNPIKVLMDEHQEVLRKLDTLEDQIRQRDVEGLWVTTAAVENDIILHSIKKEESVLFPLVEGKISMGSRLIGIMDEDHREFITLLHAYRCGLQDGEMLDGIIRSVIVNLRNHIRKEDEEFFMLVYDNVSVADMEKIYDDMLKIDKAHVTFEAGDRKAKGLSPYAEDRRKLDAEIASFKSSSAVGGEEMCCGG